MLRVNEKGNIPKEQAAFDCMYEYESISMNIDSDVSEIIQSILELAAKVKKKIEILEKSANHE